MYLMVGRWFKEFQGPMELRLNLFVEIMSTLLSETMAYHTLCSMVKAMAPLRKTQHMKEEQKIWWALGSYLMDEQHSNQRKITSYQIQKTNRIS